MTPDLSTLSHLLEKIAKNEVMSRFQRSNHREKPDGSVVTQADTAVQSRMAEALHEHWPGYPFLGEEMSADDQQSLLADSPHGLWCMDPLDGSSNFVGGFPFFSVSLALVREGRVDLGIVYDPLRNDCYGAERGKGAWLNGMRLHSARSKQSLSECLAVVDYKRLPSGLARRLASEPPYRSQRNLGSVALEWCWLAAQRFQLYLHGGQKLWDYAAGRLILQEAHGADCLLLSGQTNCSDSIDLTPRIALAASDEILLKRWRHWLEL